MLRSLFSFLKSPVHSFPALAAAIGCLVSGYSTFNGVAEIFPDFGYSVLAALGLAAIIQLGMVTSTLAFREQPAMRPLFGAVIAFTVVMSSFTSYVFYYRGFSEETITKERLVERQESLRAYLVDVRAQTAGVLGTLQGASAELARRIEIEESSGGGLRNLSNPYLQKLIEESSLDVDLRRVQSGTGERYRFLIAVEPRLQKMQQEVATGLASIDGEIEALAQSDSVDDAMLRRSYARASAAVPSKRIEELTGAFTTVAVDPAILDTAPLEEEEYWQRAASELAAGAPAAVVFATIALFMDLMIVFFAYIAGTTKMAASAARLPFHHWIEIAYGTRLEEGVRRWLSALDGTRLVRDGAILHRVDQRLLDSERDVQCGRLLRQDGYVRQVVMEDGTASWCLTDGAYAGLVELARSGASQAAAVVQQEPALS